MIFVYDFNNKIYGNFNSSLSEIQDGIMLNQEDRNIYHFENNFEAYANYGENLIESKNFLSGSNLVYFQNQNKNQSLEVDYSTQDDFLVLYFNKENEYNLNIEEISSQKINHKTYEPYLVFDLEEDTSFTKAKINKNDYILKVYNEDEKSDESYYPQRLDFYFTGNKKETSNDFEYLKGRILSYENVINVINKNKGEACEYSNIEFICKVDLSSNNIVIEVQTQNFRAEKTYSFERLENSGIDLTSLKLSDSSGNFADEIYYIDANSIEVLGDFEEKHSLKSLFINIENLENQNKIELDETILASSKARFNLYVYEDNEKTNENIEILYQTFFEPILKIFIK